MLVEDSLPGLAGLEKIPTRIVGRAARGQLFGHRRAAKTLPPDGARQAGTTGKQARSRVGH